MIKDLDAGRFLDTKNLTFYKPRGCPSCLEIRVPGPASASMSCS